MDKRIENGHWYTAITNLHPWEKNARYILDDDFERLKAQLVDLGVYKDLLVTSDGTIIGGNMRYRAMSYLNENVWTRTLADGTTKQYDLRGTFNEVRITELGFHIEPATDTTPTRVYAVIDGDRQERVFPSVEQIMIEYNMSDNDQAGRTDRDAMAMLLQPYQELIPQDMYKIEVAAPIDVDTLLSDYQPDGTNPTEEELPPEPAKQKKHRISFEFADEDQVKDIKQQLEDIKMEAGVEDDGEVLVYLLKSHFDPLAMSGTDMPTSEETASL